MLKKSLLFILLTFFAFILCIAQTKKISGRVVSIDKSTPLASVTISLKGTKVNTITAEDGGFSLFLCLKVGQVRW